MIKFLDLQAINEPYRESFHKSLDELVDSGWGMADWPSEWHGRDLPARLVRLVEDEFAVAGAVGAARQGIRLLAAATLGLAAATDEPIHVFNPSTLPVRTRSHTVSPAWPRAGFSRNTC